MTVSYSKYQQLKKCGLLPTTTAPMSQNDANLIPERNKEEDVESLQMLLQLTKDDANFWNISKERLTFAHKLMKEAQEAPLTRG